jgi:hypothetical protein
MNDLMMINIGINNQPVNFLFSMYNIYKNMCDHKRHSSCHKKHSSCHKKHHRRNSKCKEVFKNFAPATYKLVRRVLADGTVLSGSNVQGLVSYSKNGYRTLSVLIQYPNQQFFMASINSKFSLTETTYTDSLISLALQVPAPGTPQPTVYQFDNQSGTAPVTCKDGVITIMNLPVDPLSKAVFTKDSFTAYGTVAAGGFVDFWIRVD